MICIGIYKGYRVFYDIKHNEYLLMNPNYGFNRRFEHAANCDDPIVKWAINCREQHRKKIESGELKHRRRG